MFTDQERAIFPYDAGDGSGKTVFGDPMLLHRRLAQALEGSPNRWIEQYNSEDMAIALPAAEKLVEAVRWAFEMTPYDKATGRGAMEADVLKVLHDYLDFMDKKKVNAAPLPTSEPLTDSPALPSITEPTLVSGSTPVVPGFSPLSLSPKGYKQP